MTNIGVLKHTLFGRTKSYTSSSRMPYIGSLRNESCTASPTQAAYGATVTITADDIHGKVFSGWTVESGGVTLADSSAQTTTFTMGAKAVEIRADYIWFAVPLAELIAAVFWGR